MAKEMTKYTRVVNKLAKMFGYANEYYFNNELPVPTITVQSSAMSFAHISVSPVWVSETGDSYELNISADYLNRPIENVTASLLHEMSHLYNMVHGIKDVSGGYYHNKKFKKTAEEIAHLQIEQDSKYGWTVTSPTESTLDFIIAYGLEDFKISRKSDLFIGFGGTDNNGSPRPVKKTKPKGSNSIKWVCDCGTIIRSTREVNVMCCDCGSKFHRA